MINDIEALEKRIGEEITVGVYTPNAPDTKYRGLLVDYDGEYFIFQEEDRRVHISKHTIRFPN